MKDDNKGEKVLDAKGRASTFLKSRMFDFIAVGIVISLFMLTLGVLELRKITWTEILNIVVESLPFYLAVNFLSMNYYSKGSFEGKLTANFIAVSRMFSTKANSLTGKQISVISDFCEDYNFKVLKSRQSSVLRRSVLTYEDFAVDYVTYTNLNGERHEEHHGPLCNMSKIALVKLIGHPATKNVLKAQRMTVKGLRVNLLLGNNDVDDSTDIGYTESQLIKRRAKNYALRSFFFIAILMILVVKDVAEWGWAGLIYSVFRVLMIVCNSYTRYFEGYEDITVRLSNHLSRKTDILKEFEYWYGENYPEKVC